MLSYVLDASGDNTFSQNKRQHVTGPTACCQLCSGRPKDGSRCSPSLHYVPVLCVSVIHLAQLFLNTFHSAAMTVFHCLCDLPALPEGGAAPLSSSPCPRGLNTPEQEPQEAEEGNRAQAAGQTSATDTGYRVRTAACGSRLWRRALERGRGRGLGPPGLQSDSSQQQLRRNPRFPTSLDSGPGLNLFVW